MRGRIALLLALAATTACTAVDSVAPRAPSEPNVLTSVTADREEAALQALIEHAIRQRDALEALLRHGTIAEMSAH